MRSQIISDTVPNVRWDVPIAVLARVEACLRFFLKCYFRSIRRDRQEVDRRISMYQLSVLGMLVARRGVRQSDFRPRRNSPRLRAKH